MLLSLSLSVSVIHKRNLNIYTPISPQLMNLKGATTAANLNLPEGARFVEEEGRNFTKNFNLFYSALILRPQ